VSGNLRSDRISHSSRTRVTDAQGHFHLSELPRGEIDLQAVVPGIADRSFYLGHFPTGKQEVRIELDTRRP